MHAKLVQQAGATFIDMPAVAKAVVAALLMVLILATAELVYRTGGAKYAYLHFMYIPVVVAGFAFGVPGGVLAGFLGGFLLGPYMPLDVIVGAMQKTPNWIYRLAFFVLVGGLVGTFQQLLRRHLREIRWLQEHHKDTGLLNLTGLLKELDSLVKDAPDSRKLVVAVTQLNAFLDIQNTFGIDFSRHVLSHVVERTKSLVPPGSLVALIQPDRLATVLRGANATRITRSKIAQAIKESYAINSLPIHVEASIGVARFPKHARTPEELVQKASIAMHWAASRKVAVSLYDSANDDTSRDNLILLGTLPGAIARGELQVWHQAKVALATDTVVGTEALLRWKHPKRGLIPPGSFIPQVEETSLINPVTQTVIAQAFADAGAWRKAGHRLRVSVNLSVRNLGDRMIVDVLEQNAQLNEIDPSGIDLEIVESAVMADPDYCAKLIAMLRKRGYSVSIDDFGTGQSSLAYLQKLQVSCLKIDQSFVKTLATNPQNQKIVRAILHLAHSLGLETVAEGVEDMAAAALLRDWGCDYGQGYGFHRPAPSADFMRFVSERKAEAPQAT